MSSLGRGFGVVVSALLALAAALICLLAYYLLGAKQCAALGALLAFGGGTSLTWGIWANRVRPRALIDNRLRVRRLAINREINTKRFTWQGKTPNSLLEAQEAATEQMVQERAAMEARLINSHRAFGVPIQHLSLWLLITGVAAGAFALLSA